MSWISWGKPTFAELRMSTIFTVKYFYADHVYMNSKLQYFHYLQFYLLYFSSIQVWDLFQNKDEVRDMIVCKIQEESLRTYLFTYSSVYDTLSLVTLADMFELDVYKVHSIISKMIINEELMVGHVMLLLFSFLCPHCKGTGHLDLPLSVRKILKKLGQRWKSWTHF